MTKQRAAMSILVWISVRLGILHRLNQSSLGSSQESTSSYASLNVNLEKLKVEYTKFPNSKEFQNLEGRKAGLRVVLCTFQGCEPECTSLRRSGVRWQFLLIHPKRNHLDRAGIILLYKWTQHSTRLGGKHP